MKLQGGWHYDEVAKTLQIALDQTQTQGLYRMPIEIAITLPVKARAGTGRGAPAPVVQIAKILIEQQHNVLNLPLESAPLDVQIDPNMWVPLMQPAFVHQTGR